MKILFLPVKLIKFWYPESLVFFLRTLRNTIFYLEEDLAVGLMLKLLFVPLFHDSSIVGKLLSFSFRVFRIIVGLFAFLLVTILLFVIAIYWFALPFIVIILTIKGIYPELNLLNQLILIVGIILFIFHLISHPLKKLWLTSRNGQITNINDIWKCSLISEKDLSFGKLLMSDEVKEMLLYLEKTPEDFINLNPQPEKEKILVKALELGKQTESIYISRNIFFVSLILETPNIESFLMKIGLETTDFINALAFLQKKSNKWRRIYIWDEDFAIHHLKGVNRGWLSTPTPFLDSVSEDLTKRAGSEKIANFVGRGAEVSEIINILSLENNRNVVIVGEPGSGKGAIVLYLAKLIISGDAPPALSTKRLVYLDFTKLLSGIKTQGDLAERVKNIFEEVEFCGNIIIFVDEIQNLGLGEASTNFNLYSLLLPFIESSKNQFITTTEPGDYTKVLEKNGSFARLFTKIDLGPATEKDTIEILQNRAIDLIRRKKIKTSDLAIGEIVKLSAKYIHDRVLPDSALHIFEICQSRAEKYWIKKSLVETVIQDFVKVPVADLASKDITQVLNLGNIIHQRLIDQNEAVEAVVNSLQRKSANLTSEKRPIGSFLFVGPTGVGKTELSKILSEEYFKGKGSPLEAPNFRGEAGGQFLRFDMSEYQTSEAVDKLVGKNGEEGYLTGQVRSNPYSLILLDEFEKADPKILNLFLQVLEDGRLTDGLGKTVDFQDVIIIATSNAGSLLIAQGLASGKPYNDLEKEVNEELLKIFKPELINRFDRVVLFKPLSKEDLGKVVQLKLSALQNKLKEQGFVIEFSPELVNALAEKGYDPTLGARPLRRLIQDTLETKLSRLILENKLPKGESAKVGVELLT
ncbi:MAG: ATP-dependent Clp protease ATP-binding subunit [Candidatus Daviesbacteria bacterium]|nr:ATP-dependent Clp protease ATP-binding subunit [Candidatus Daviesbacteria bacterium]